ncbi:50S ribosome-binding GTPase [Candidatus Bathyarchaeota archaeon]|nr:50S ribosome-binding GTPase [Candidatus Bathyarchaeota archaeon]
MPAAKSSSGRGLLGTAKLYKREARWASRKCIKHLQRVGFILSDLNQRIASPDDLAVPRGLSVAPAIKKCLADVRAEIKCIVEQGYSEMLEFLGTQRDHFSDFTLVLFGRTKSGKSTLAEALTCGDGSSIGKGAQRTTQCIRAVSWNGLRVLDTPGLSAYRGEVDAEKARKAVNQADVVLFLVTDDAIQVDEFEDMGRLLEMNKPFFILLNVKHDINDRSRRDRVLHNPALVFDGSRLDGHTRRIKTYSEQCFKTQAPRIMPVHLLAAFQANHELDHSTKARLRTLSRLGQVEGFLTETVTSKGLLFRDLSFFDNLICWCETIEQFLLRYAKSLQEQAEFLVARSTEMGRFFAEFRVTVCRRFESVTRERLNAIRERVPTFVEDHAGRQDAEAKWKDLVGSSGLEQAMASVSEETKSEIEARFAELDRQSRYDATALRVGSLNLSGLKKGKVADITKWLGVSTSPASLVLVLALGASNPIGWVVLGGGFVLGVASLLFRRREARVFAEKKARMQEKALRQVERVEEEALKAAMEWYDREIDSSAKAALAHLDSVARNLVRTAQTLQVSSGEVRNTIEDANRCLFLRLLLHGGASVPRSAIAKVCRLVGRRAFVVLDSHGRSATLERVKEAFHRLLRGGGRRKGENHVPQLTSEVVAVFRESDGAVEKLISCLGDLGICRENVTWNGEGLQLRLTQDLQQRLVGGEADLVSLAELAIGSPINIE